MKEKLLVMVLMIAVACIGLAGCGGGGGGAAATPEEEGTGEEAGSPSVVITSPTGLTGYTTTSSSVAVAGKATDDTSVSGVAWANDAGGSGDATLSASDFSADVSLSSGDNNVTFTATDSGGNTSTASLLVVYNPNLGFTSGLQLSQDYVFVNESTSITATIAIAADSGVVANSVKLLRVASDSSTSELVTMTDDGATNGDDIASDNVYSGQYTFSESSTGTVALRVTASTAEGAAYSEKVELVVMNRLTTAEFSTIKTIAGSEDAAGTAEAQYDSYKAGGMSASEAASALASWLESQDGIAKAGVSSSGNGVWWVYSSGVLGGLILEADEIRGGGFAKSPNIIPQLKAISAPKAAGDDTITVGSNKAKLIASFYTQFEGWGGDETDEINQWLTDSTCPQYDVDGTYQNANATVEQFQNLEDFGVVVITSHGDSWYPEYDIDLGWFGEIEVPEGFGDPPLFEPGKSRVVILTRTALTDDNKATYEADLKMHRLVVTGSGWLAITPEFVRWYNRGMPDSVVYLGSCRSTWNNTMANAFLAVGAKVVYGYSDYVNSAFAYNHGMDIFDDLINNGIQSGAVSGIGDNDADATPAELMRKGVANLTLAITGLLNGGFEEGSMDGWTGVGDARVITGLGSLSPQEGSYMGIISSGLGSVSGDSSYMQQSFCVPAGNTTLSFTYDYVSEEPQYWVGSSFNDIFTATVLDADGVVLNTMASESVNGASWSHLGGNYFSGGDSGAQSGQAGAVHDGTFHTGWSGAVTFDVSAYAGQSIPLTLKFYTEDQGDTIWDSAAVIDNITLE